MNRAELDDVRSLMLDTDHVERALHEAVVRAMMRHKRLGSPIVVWRDGEVVWIPAEAIVIPDSGTDPALIP